MNQNNTTFTNSNINSLVFSDTSKIPQIITSSSFQNPNSKKESTVAEKNQMNENRRDSTKSEEKNPFDISCKNITVQNENISNAIMLNTSINNNSNPSTKELNFGAKPEINTLNGSGQKLNGGNAFDQNKLKNVPKNNTPNKYKFELNLNETKIIRINLDFSKGKKKYQRTQNLKNQSVEGDKCENKSAIKCAIKETGIENKFENVQNKNIIEAEEIVHVKNLEKSQKDATFQIISKGINTNILGFAEKKTNDPEIENGILTDNFFVEKEKQEGNNTLSLNTIFNPSEIYKIEQFGISDGNSEFFVDKNIERKIENGSPDKRDNNSNKNKSNVLDKNENIDSPIENKEKISLSETDAIDPQFHDKFKKYLLQEKIEIKNNFPINENKNSFKKSRFWYLLLYYLFEQSNNISLHCIFNLLEQYHKWAEDKNENMFRSIKGSIKNYIKKNYSKDVVATFLKNNNYDDLNQIFQKFDILNYNSNNYIEIKFDNVNTLNDGSIIKCKCDLCTNNNACFRKVSELNKNLISKVNENNFYYAKASPQELFNNEKIHKHNISNKNEEMLLKNKAKQKVNYFTKSKTIFTAEPNIELEYIPNKNPEKIFEDNNGHSNNNCPNEQKRNDLENINLKGKVENDNIIHKKKVKFIVIKTGNSKQKKKHLTKINNKKKAENENKEEKAEKNEEAKSCKIMKKADNNIKKSGERETFQNKKKEENLLTGMLKECLNGNWKSNNSDEVEIDNSSKNDSKSQDKKRNQK